MKEKKEGKMKHLLKIACVMMVVSVLFVFTNQVRAESVELILISSFTENVLDSAGSYQYSTGKVFIEGKEVGKFTSSRRFTLGNDIPNIATITLVLFVPQGTAAPESITIQGLLNLETGNYSGSVSAVTDGFKILKGQSISGNTVSKTLILNW